MLTMNYIVSTPINYPIIIVPAGCQFNIDNGQICSGGFIVYNKPKINYYDKY
jgi:hypothetical protein